jgi:hypothetical protein
VLIFVLLFILSLFYKLVGDLCLRCTWVSRSILDLILNIFIFIFWSEVFYNVVLSYIPHHLRPLNLFLCSQASTTVAGDSGDKLPVCTSSSRLFLEMLVRSEMEPPAPAKEGDGEIPEACGPTLVPPFAEPLTADLEANFKFRWTMYE